MIWSALVASLVVVGLQDASAERPARPTDKELLAAVQAEVAGARIVSSEFTDTPRGGGRVGCGLFEAQGAIEPFRVFTSWYDGQPERIPPAVLNFGGEQGSRTAIPSEPQPAEPAHWKIRITAPALVDAGAAGIDRRDRNRMIGQRRMALSSCKSLVAPEGVVWVTDFEADPARRRLNEERAKALTDMIFRETR